MTNIKINGNRIIFDGHSDTRQECETITLMANLLNSCGSGFNTVEYRAGYAEFVKSDCIKLRNDELKFIPNDNSVSFEFDEHITKVVGTVGGTEFEWATSGSYNTVSNGDAVSILCTVYFDGQYKIAAIEESEEYMGGTFSITGDNTFVLNSGSYGSVSKFIITSEPAATKQTIDVSTLSGWANLSTGNHQITIKTKASGYADSAASNAVTVSKAASGYTVTFDDQETGSATGAAYYSLDDGATWTRFCEILSDESNDLSPTSLTNITSIKFKIEINNVGIPPTGVRLECSAINLSLGGKNTGTFTSDNYTLTEDITVIIT